MAHDRPIRHHRRAHFTRCPRRSFFCAGPLPAPFSSRRRPSPRAYPITRACILL